MNTIPAKKIFFYSLLFLAHVFTSCINTKKITYFRDIPDTSHKSSAQITRYSDPLIQPDDILSITIQTIDPTTSVVINQLGAPMPAVGTSSANPIGQQQISGFLVDKEGFVELTMIGKVKLDSLTTYQARELIRTKALQYFKNVSVNVRFANFKITVLGEVAKPATYTVPNEKVTLLDALGLAGDLTIYGKRDNVLLIRDNNGQKEFERFDLRSSKIFESPYYYLKQNDVIYVQANRSKVASTNSVRTQTYAIIGTTLSVLIVLLSSIL